MSRLLPLFPWSPIAQDRYLHVDNARLTCSGKLSAIHYREDAAVTVLATHGWTVQDTTLMGDSGDTAKPLPGTLSRFSHIAVMTSGLDGLVMLHFSKKSPMELQVFMYADLARLHPWSLSRFSESCAANGELGKMPLVTRNLGSTFDSESAFFTR